MGRNRKKTKTKSRPKSNSKQQAQALAVARRCLEKGRFKDALKQARIASRQKPGPDAQEVLERATLERADQLQRQGMNEQCQELLLPLARSASQSEVQARLPEVLLRAGLLDRCPEYRDAVSDDLRESIQVEQFDQAVLDPGKADKSNREEVTLIRGALDAIENGRDEDALALLRDIPRKSNAAEWRLFARGLIAWYQRDEEAVESNWERLDDSRPPARIADRLQAWRHTRPQLSGSARRALETAGKSRSAFARLIELRNYLIADNWKEVLNRWNRVRNDYRDQPVVVECLTQAAVTRLIKGGSKEDFRRFQRLAAPSPVDPRWNRMRALLDEEDDYHNHARSWWEKYLDDLDDITVFSDRDREIVRSLVLLRLGEGCILALRDDMVAFGKEIEAEVRDRMYEEARQYLENSIEACPEHRKAWDRLVQLHEMTDHPSAMERTVLRMLEQFPNDLGTLLKAGECGMEMDKPDQAREHFRDARRLRPLDDQICKQLVAAHQACLRKRLSENDLVAAANELADARELFRDGDGVEHAEVEALAAMHHVMSGRSSAAEQTMKTVHEYFDEKTPGLLLLKMEAARLNLSSKLQEQLKRQWKAELKRRCQAQTACELAGLMIEAESSHVAYEGSDADRDDVLAYIRRAKRVSYSAQQLRTVCRFLLMVDERDLLEKYVRKGCKKFPDEPWFPMQAGKLELIRGADKCDRKKAIKHFSRVVELLEDRDESLDNESVDILNGARMYAGLLRRLEMLSMAPFSAPPIWD